ncbi:MAG TPA: hypothetical protein VIH57_07920 [Bacteroidales bacterium]
MEKTKAIKYQILKVTVPSAGETVNINVTTDKMYKKITGILASFPFYISFLQKSTLSLSINDKEIFPDEFEVKLISFGPGVPTNELFYLLDEEANGSTIKGKFKDGTDALGFPYPYTVIIYLRLEDKS